MAKTKTKKLSEILKQKKVKIGIIILFLLLIFVLAFFLFPKERSEPKEEEPTEIVEEHDSFSLERVEKQEKSIKVIQNYLTTIPNLNAYAKENNKREITIKELQNVFNLNIDEFEQLPYGCSSEKTFILFNEDFSKNTIVLSCTEFLFQ